MASAYVKLFFISSVLFFRNYLKKFKKKCNNYIHYYQLLKLILYANIEVNIFTDNGNVDIFSFYFPGVSDRKQFFTLDLRRLNNVSNKFILITLIFSMQLIIHMCLLVDRDLLSILTKGPKFRQQHHLLQKSNSTNIIYLVEIVAL